MNGVHCGIGATGLSKQNPALLINGEYTSSCALGYFFETDGTDQGGASVTKKRVREVLLRPKSSVGFWRIGRKTVDRQPRRCEMSVTVAKQAGLLCAWKRVRDEAQL